MDLSSGLPDVIFSMLLAKCEIVGGRDIHRLSQMQIHRRGSSYDVIRFIGILDDADIIPDYPGFDQGHDIRSAVARAVILENRALRKEWRIANRDVARATNGLEAIAQKMGVDRLLVGMNPIRHTWVYTPHRFDDWQWRAAERNLRVVRAEL